MYCPGFTADAEEGQRGYTQKSAQQGISQWQCAVWHLRIKLVIALAMMHLACQVREVVSLLALGHWSFPKKPGGTCSCVPVSFACPSLT